MIGLNMRFIFSIALIFLTGCAAPMPAPELMQSEFKLSVIFDDKPMHKGIIRAAKTSWGNGTCVITIQPEYYTHKCLGHELRHCLEGDWHEGRNYPCDR